MRQAATRHRAPGDFSASGGGKDGFEAKKTPLSRGGLIRFKLTVY